MSRADNEVATQFEKVDIMHVQWAANVQTDALAGLAASFNLRAGESLKILVSERRLISRFEES